MKYCSQILKQYAHVGSPSINTRRIAAAYLVLTDARSFFSRGRHTFINAVCNPLDATRSRHQRDNQYCITFANQVVTLAVISFHSYLRSCPVLVVDSLSLFPSPCQVVYCNIVF